MKSEFQTALQQLIAERNLPKEVVMETVHTALVSAYKKSFGAAENIRVDVDRTGEVRVFVQKHVVETVTEPQLEMTVIEAQGLRPAAKLGDLIEVEAGPQIFGRINAQTAKQVILQRIREAERDHVYEQFHSREGELINGTIQRIEPRGVIIDLGKAQAEGILPPTEQVPGEHYRVGQRLRAYLYEIHRTHSKGLQVMVSRTHINLVRRLFELEVPEIFDGTVEIKGIAREPGSRTKVAVAARQEGLDPIGSCVGIRGIRINNIVAELKGEKIDIIEWNANPAVFVANALSPVKVLKVELREAENKAMVTVPEKQLSLAIGRGGQNASLAAKLTRWRIDVIKEPSAEPVAAPVTVPEASMGTEGL